MTEFTSSYQNSSTPEIRVLLVDDEEAYLELAKFNLEEADPSLEIQTISDARTAISLIKEQNFDCVVSDYQMPGINGVQLCTEVRRFSRKPFIIYTGHGSEEVASAAFSAGVDDYIRKETELSHYKVLVRRIRHAVERRRIEDLYLDVAENSRDAITILWGTTIVYANRAMAKLVGMTVPTDLIGGYLTRWIVEEDKKRVTEIALARQRGESAPQQYEFSFKRVDGSVRSVDVSASLISFRGKPASLSFVRDITERKHAEEALRKSNEQLEAANEKLRMSQETLQRYLSTLEETVEEKTRELKSTNERYEVFINAATDGFSIYDSNLNLLDVNDAWLRRLPEGTSRTDVIGKNMIDIYPGVKATPRYREFFKVMTTGVPYFYEGYLAGTLVKSRYYLASVFKVGAGIGIVSRDITYRRSLEQELRRGEVMAAIGRMGATIAHDLRNPLNIISQSADAVATFPDRSSQFISMIKDNASRALDMIEELRAATSDIKVSREETDLTTLLRKAIEDAGAPTTIRVEVETCDGLEAIRVDPTLIRRVLDNLIVNAIDAMPDGGKLNVRAHRVGESVEVEIKDTGIGITEEAAARIFEPFYTTKAKGFGLGLAFCRRAIEAHRGSITFKTKVGEGTTFTISLPIT